MFIEWHEINAGPLLQYIYVQDVITNNNKIIIKRANYDMHVFKNQYLQISWEEIDPFFESVLAADSNGEFGFSS